MKTSDLLIMPRDDKSKHWADWMVYDEGAFDDHVPGRKVVNTSLLYDDPQNLVEHVYKTGEKPFYKFAVENSWCIERDCNEWFHLHWLHAGSFEVPKDCVGVFVFVYGPKANAMRKRGDDHAADPGQQLPARKFICRTPICDGHYAESVIAFNPGDVVGLKPGYQIAPWSQYGEVPDLTFMYSTQRLRRCPEKPGLSVGRVFDDKTEPYFCRPALHYYFAD